MAIRDATLPYAKIACPLCEGVGYWEKKICRECQGISYIAWTGEYMLFWGKTVDTGHLIYDRLLLTVKNIINAILLIIGSIGILLFFWEFYNITQSNQAVWKIFQTYNFTLLFFWITILSDCYLYYRYSSDLARMQHVPRKLLKTTSFRQEKITWQELKLVPDDQKIDISHLFTSNAVDAVMGSYNIAKKYGHFKVTPLHLFVFLLTKKEILLIFIRLGTHFQELKTKIINALRSYGTPTNSQLHFTEKFYTILFDAYYDSWQKNKRKIHLSDLLVSLVKNSDTLTEILYDCNIDLNKIQNVALWIGFQKHLTQSHKRFRSRAALRPRSPINRSMTALATPYLDNFSQDLTALARDGYLEPCIGRQKEIEEVFKIIEGGHKKGVILVGPPGIGKRTIVNGIAQLMVAEDVPEVLQDKRLISLSVAKLTSGAAPAEASQRLMIIMSEILRSGNIVLFINDVSKMIGISQGGPGSIDLAEVLSQTLTKSSNIAITTSLPLDFTRYIENNSSLLQVLEKINVTEVSGNNAIQILEAKSTPIEFKQNVFFSYDAVAKTIELCERYIHERYLPEKAIEILEEAADAGRDIFHVLGEIIEKNT